MSLDTAVDYLSKLLNRPLTPESALRLSSAQRARFQAWLHDQGMRSDDARLAAEFQLSTLFSSTASAVDTETTVAPSDVGMDASAPAVGIDIQSIGELLANIAGNDFKADPELTRLFTMRELSYAQARSDRDETLAGVFAAKEAIRKCIGTPSLSQEDFRALEVLPDANGRPTAPGYAVSISHSGDFAIAVAWRLPARQPAAAVPVPSPVAAAPAPKGKAAGWLTPVLLAAVLVLISLHLLLLVRTHA